VHLVGPLIYRLCKSLSPSFLCPFFDENTKSHKLHTSHCLGSWDDFTFQVSDIFSSLISSLSILKGPFFSLFLIFRHHCSYLPRPGFTPFLTTMTLFGPLHCSLPVYVSHIIIQVTYFTCFLGPNPSYGACFSKMVVSTNKTV
jgi:hypothetical protein